MNQLCYGNKKPYKIHNSPHKPIADGWIVLHKTAVSFQAKEIKVLMETTVRIQ